MSRKYPEFSEKEEELVKKVASQMIGHYGLTETDREDLEQELITHLWQKRDAYNPNHPSKCSYETFINNVLNKKRLDMLKERDTDKRRLNWQSRSLSEFDSDDDARIAGPDLNNLANGIANEICNEAELSIEDYVILKDELRNFLEKLPPEQRKMCRMLCDGYSPSEIADELRIPRTTIYSQIKKIKKDMEEAALLDFV